MAKNGGARPGAGRPKGPTLPRFADYVKEEDRKTFVEFILSSYMGDMRVATWMGDQLFGKAPQGIEVSGGLDLSIVDDETRQKANGAIAAILPEGDTE